MHAPPSRTWKLTLVVGVLLAAVYVMTPYEPFGGFAFFAFRLSAAVAIVFAVRRHRPFRPTAWLILGGAVALTALGDATWVWLELQGLEPFPSVADGFYLSASVLFAVALLMLGRRDELDYGVLGDALIVGISAAVLAWAFLIAPFVHDVTLTMSGRVISIAYPATDVVLLVLVLRLVFLRGARLGAHLLLLLGMASLLAAHVVYALGNIDGWYAPGGVVDGIWLVSFALLAAAALHPSAAAIPPSADRASLSSRRLAGLATAAVFAPTVILVSGAENLEVVRVAAVASILLVLLIVNRMAGLMRETRRQGVELEQLSRTDPLTGAANRRHLDRELARELSRADRAGTPLSLAFLDLDHFKRFNDTRGHPAGDVLLAELVAAWRDVLRPVDLLARFGGEEFVVVFPGSTMPQAAVAVERLRALVPNGQTCSAGLTDLLPGERADALIARADHALYQAKSNGRDQTVRVSGLVPA